MAGPSRLLRIVLTRAAVTAVRALPPGAIPALAWLGGTTWYLYDGRRRRRIAENLRIAFGEAAAGRRGRCLARRVFRNMLRVPIEVIWLDRLAATPRQIEARCTFHGPWTTGAAGGVLFTGHLGNWEMLIRAARHRLGRLVSIVRTIPDPTVDAFVSRTRGEVVPKHGAYREITRRIGEGAWVFLAGDQNAGPEGPFVPFFGLPASTHASPALFALRLGVPVVLAVAIRRPGRVMQFDLILEPIAAPPAHEPEAEEVRALVARLTERLEQRIRGRPEQYNFLHRRWKNRPLGETPGAHLPTYDHHRPRARGSTGGP